MKVQYLFLQTLSRSSPGVREMGDGRVPHACPKYNTPVTEIGIQKNDMATGVRAQYVKWDEDFFKKVFARSGSTSRQ